MIDLNRLFANPLEELQGAGVRAIRQRFGLPELLPALVSNPEEDDDDPDEDLLRRRNPLPRNRTDRGGRLAGYSSGSLQELFHRIRRQASGVYVVIGPRGSAKTGFALRLTEMIGRRRVSLGRIRGLRNEYARVTRDIRVVEPEDLPNLPAGTVVIIDDASAAEGASSADYTSDAARNIKKLIDLSRHCGLTFVVTVQQASGLNKYFLDADAAFFKPPGRVAAELNFVVERDKLDRIQTKVRKVFEFLPRSQWPCHVYAISEEYVGLIKYDYPRGMGR